MCGNRFIAIFVYTPSEKPAPAGGQKRGHGSPRAPSSCLVASSSEHERVGAVSSTSESRTRRRDALASIGRGYVGTRRKLVGCRAGKNRRAGQRYRAARAKHARAHDVVLRRRVLNYTGRVIQRSNPDRR